MHVIAAVREQRVADRWKMPGSWRFFERYCLDHPEYREQALPRSVTARVSVEEASTLGWARYVGSNGHSIGLDTFGASAPLKELQKQFGFVPESILVAARQQIEKARHLHVTLTRASLPA